jgi:hypothetical protein
MTETNIRIFVSGIDFLFLNSKNDIKIPSERRATKLLFCEGKEIINTIVISCLFKSSEFL